MITWFAGNTAMLRREESLIYKTKFSRLLSYYVIEKDLFNARITAQATMGKVDLFLDSGAFSAWTQGKEINIREYIEFIKEHEDVISVYANLDVIGDAKATWKNQQIMEKEGLDPMPVYHLGDPISYLKFYVSNYSYVGVGGLAGRDVSTETRQRFLDRCFEIICDTPDNTPRCKIHGFGMTALKLMLRYPWYSVDSTSWIVNGRVGSIFVPRKKNGEWIYDQNSWKVTVSTRSPTTKEAGKHIDNFPPRQRDAILQYIHEKGYKLGKSEFKKVSQAHELADNERWAEKKPKGKTEKRLLEVIVEQGISNWYQLRDELNVIYFMDLEKSLPEWPWSWNRKSMKGFAL